MSTTAVIDQCDTAAYRSWTTRRVTPAYMRGLPTWMWTSALCRQRAKTHAT
jgi:hypothetical protein